MTDVEELKEMLAGEFDKARLDAILAKYVDMVPWLVIDLPAQYTIFRGRLMQGDDVLYMHRKEMSYPPAEYAPMGRVSYENHPMFYASIIAHDEHDVQLPWVTIAAELDIFAKDEARKDVTYSIWENHRELRLAALPFSSQYQRGLVAEIAKIQKEWEDKVMPHMTHEEIELATFFSDLLVLPRSQKIYQFTAGFFEFFLHQSEEGKPLDGIIYLSTPSRGKGLNICLKPEVADWLELKKALYTIFYKKEELTRIVYAETDGKSVPWKWYFNPDYRVERIPEQWRKRYARDDAQKRKEIKEAVYNRGKSKLVRRKDVHNILKEG